MAATALEIVKRSNSGGVVKKGKQFGEGGFGCLFHGTFGGKACAIKEPKRDGDKGIRSEDSLLREYTGLARVAGHGGHQNVQELYGLSVETKEQSWLLVLTQEIRTLQLITRFYSGGNLWDYMLSTAEKSGDIPDLMIKQLIKGLAFLHSLNIVLVDIKPANVFLEETSHGEMQCRWGDFGGSWCTDSDEKQVAFNGTPNYSAPEYLDMFFLDSSKRFISSSRLTKPSDIYSFSILLYEMMTLTQFVVDSAEALLQIQQGSLRPPVEDVPKLRRKLLSDMWDSKPANRLTINDVQSSFEVVSHLGRGS